MATPIAVMLPTICPASVAIAPWAQAVSAAKEMTSGSAIGGRFRGEATAVQD
ncbi:hypothetical protein ACTHAX_04680 [Methylobacterium fujisawaense]|uniref:hypothetical protein n=1 Tax=Methylobacterium fujisawaense TaxID=107400 RepID=UPI00313A86C3